MSKLSEVAGVVSKNEIYTLPEIGKRLGMGSWALRQARREGLPILRIGRRGYVRGSDLFNFFDKKAGEAAMET